MTLDLIGMREPFPRGVSVGAGFFVLCAIVDKVLLLPDEDGLSGEGHLPWPSCLRKYEGRALFIDC